MSDEGRAEASVDGAALVGTVCGSAGAPVEGAQVRVVAAPMGMPEIAAVTDAEGRFRFALPAAGEYTLEAEGAEGGRPSTRATITVPPSSRATAFSMAEPDSDFDPDAEESSDASGDPVTLPPGEIPTITVELRLGDIV